MRFLGWIVIIILVFILYLMISPKRQVAGSISYQTSTISERKTEARTLVKNEPKVLDAYINEAGVLYAAVIDDGTKRNGYAMYLCEVFRSKKNIVTRVKIIEYGSSKSPRRDNAYGILLGEANCSIQ